jgi:hypothetical protein
MRKWRGTSANGDGSMFLHDCDTMSIHCKISKINKKEWRHATKKIKYYRGEKMHTLCRIFTAVNNSYMASIKELQASGEASSPTENHSAVLVG